MNAEELMRLDWVCLENDPTPRQVDWIRSGEVGLFWNKIVTPPYIKPIPLTPEILEKNGFEYINDEYGCWLLGKIELREREPYNGLFEVEINIGEETIYIHYLHELQHVLKLCGSQKEIVL